MKKLFLILMLCPLMMLMPSCTGNADKSANNLSKEVLLDQEIASSNAQMPIQMDNATTLLSLSRDGEIVTYEYLLDENEVDFSQFIEDKAQHRNKLSNQITLLSTTEPSMHAFMSLLKETGKSLRYRYKGNSSGVVVTIEFSNDELQEMIKD
jgi:hypothetical protein